MFTPNGEAEIEYEARIGAIVKFPMLEDRGSGYVKSLDFEKYVRAPGTRIIAIRDQKIYLQKEMRTETGYKYDWRLPGGKVFDKFKDYKQYISTEIPEEKIIEAARKELQEEAGLDAGKMKILTKKVCGATVLWDLYYILAKDLVDYDLGHEHDEAEEMEQSDWFDYKKVREMCESGEIGEGRTVAVLVQFLASQEV